MSSSPDDTTDWLICTACGTQFPTADRQQHTTCFICDDPRQFTPPTGQAFTTLGEMLSSPAGYRNEFVPYDKDERITFIYTTPKFAIGQRCALVRTPAGNILWDCVTLLDAATVDRVRALGGLAAIAISHPHYYSTHLLWARTFGCPVHLAAEDRRWLAEPDENDDDEEEEEEEDAVAPGAQERRRRRRKWRTFLAEGETERALLAGPGEGAPGSSATLLKPGGHFPGSMVLLFDGHLLVADTLVTTPAGLGSWVAASDTGAAAAAAAAAGGGGGGGGGRPRRDGRHLGRPEGMNTFAFMWSIPNMIPLSPEEISHMWDVLGRHDFVSTHGAFMGQDVEDVRVKERVLESMKIQVARMGWPEHPLLSVHA